MTACIRRSVVAITAVVLAVTAFTTSPAAASTGVLGVNVTGLYLLGQTSDLPGAYVTAENVTTGQIVPLSVYGNPATSAYYQALAVPFGQYRIRVQRDGFAPQYWPTRYSAEAAGSVTFANSPGCNPSDAAPCDIHVLGVQLTQFATVTGTIRTRSGAAVSQVPVTAQRVDEPTFRPGATTSGAGQYSLALPPGAYTLRTPNGASISETAVTVTGSTSRDIVLLDPPAVPTAVRVHPGSRNAALQWSPPADDGGSPITFYRVTASPGGAMCTTSATSCTLTGLQNGQTYRFSVSAENRIGQGAQTTTEPVLVTSETPGPVQNVRVAAGDKSLDITWSASASDDVTEYLAIASPGGRSCSTEDLSCTIRRLRNGKDYRITVQAVSAGGRSEASGPGHRVSPAGLPGTPRNVSATPKPGALRARWTPPRDDGGRRVREYVATAWPGGRTCTSENTSCLIRGLHPGTDYSITVRATTSIGAGMFSPGSQPARPQAGKSASPDRVRGLRVSVHHNRAAVTWQPVVGVRAYWVRVLDGRRSSWMQVRGNRTVLSLTATARAVQVRTRTSGVISTHRL